MEEIFIEIFINVIFKTPKLVPCYLLVLAVEFSEGSEEEQDDEGVSREQERHIVLHSPTADVCGTPECKPVHLQTIHARLTHIQEFRLPVLHVWLQTRKHFIP